VQHTFLKKTYVFISLSELEQFKFLLAEYGVAIFLVVMLYSVCLVLINIIEQVIMSK